jgi:integrase
VSGFIEPHYKSGKSRKVDMSIQLRDALRIHMKKFNLAGAGEDTQFVFTNREGNPLDKNNWRRRIFHKALEKAKIEKRGVHNLRHSYATIRINKGDNIGDVSKQLGHHSVKLTLDVYYHWIPGNKKSEVDALDDPLLTVPNAPYMHPKAEILKKGFSR